MSFPNFSTITESQSLLIKKSIERIDKGLEKTLMMLKKNRHHFYPISKNKFEIQYNMTKHISYEDRFCKIIIQNVYKNAGFYNITFNDKYAVLTVDINKKQTYKKVKYASSFNSIMELVKINKRKNNPYYSTKNSITAKIQQQCIKENIEYIDTCLEATLLKLSKKEFYYNLNEKNQFEIDYTLNSILRADKYCENIIRKVYQNAGFMGVKFKEQYITLLIDPNYKKKNEKLEYCNYFSSLEDLIKINNEIKDLDLRTSFEHIIDIIDYEIENSRKMEDITTEIWNVRINFETSYKVVKKYIKEGFKKVDFCLGIYDKENLIVKLKV